MRRDRGRQCLGRVVVKRSIEVAKHTQSVLTRRFRYQSSDMALIALPEESEVVQSWIARRLVPHRVGVFRLPGSAASAAWNPTRECVPSQNGLFLDPPHRHSAKALRFGI